MPPEVQIAWGDDHPPPAFEAAAPEGTPPEPPLTGSRWAVAFAGSVPVARLATYVRHDLTGAPGASGLVGHYAARDARAGVALLLDAAAHLRHAGAQRVLGPMNGSTWGRYRLALPHAGHGVEEPMFLGEPENPPGYHAHFLGAGFESTAFYESRITEDIGISNPAAAAGEAFVASQGVRIAALDLSRFDDELRDLHALSTRAFADNLYYSPIDAAAFDALYRPMQALIDPQLVLLARDSRSRLVAYVFAYVDPLGRRNGEPYRLIVKTLATDPDWRGRGLGGVLVERLHSAARERGLTAIVHALMHQANNSVKISAHTAQVFRRYVLYEHRGSRGR